MSEQRITAVGVSSGERAPAVPDVPVLSSAKAAWDGIFVEQHQLPASETPEICVPKHLICIHLSPPMELECRVAGERRQSRLMTPGDINFTPANLPRVVRWQSNASILFLSLDPTFMARVADELDYTNSIDFAQRWGGPDPQIHYIGLALKAELEAGGLAGPLYGESLANALCVHLLRRYSTNGRSIRDFPNGLPRDKLRKVIEYINENLEHDLSLDAIAATIGMSSYHFARMFKQSIGLAPHQYVIERRLKQAQVLLTTTELTILEVSFRVGFKSQSHFTRLFRKLTGITPRAYRSR
jgi:AraC family transcriptional regulator